MEPRADTPWRRSGKTVILVPGQVEDDASIRFGCTDVRTNIALLKAARAARPDAFIVYKPHPDVVSGNRTGKIQRSEEHTSELQSLVRSSYAVFCLKKKKNNTSHHTQRNHK